MRDVSGKGDLTTGPVGRHLVRMTVPMLWGILSMISVQLVDTFYISMLGTGPLAAIGFTFPVTMTVFSLIIGLGIAASSIVARRFGEKKHGDVTALATHAILLAAAMGVVLTLAGLAVMDPLFRAMGVDPELMSMVRSYMSIWFCGCAVMTLPLVGNSIMRALGDTLTPALIMMGLSLLNAVLAAILVFGLLGFPRLGIAGAALATVISYAAAAAASLLTLLLRKKLIFQDGLRREQFGRSARELFSIALPVGLASIIQPVTQGVMTAILAGHGSAAVAAFGVATRVENIAFVIIIALATGMSPIIGQNFGAGHHDRVRETLRLAMIFSSLWSLVVAAAMAVFAGPLAGVFSLDPAVIHVATLYFWIVPLSYAAGNLVHGWSATYNAIGQPKKGLGMIVIRMIVLQIPLAIFLGRLFGVPGVFAAIAGVNIATGLFFHLRNWPDLVQEPLETRSPA